MGGPKKPTPVCNALDTPTSVWSGRARTDVEPPQLGQPMTTDTCRLMRLKLLPLRSTAMNGHRSVLPSGSSIWAAGHPRRVVLLPGLSRMKGNLHVRFLEGGGLATARLYSEFG